ncbi:hypothetical protein AVEN_51517-1 [Araneus ventricosus]|uniref:Uncharacterized protein n=1 Tax=Araneus ventricosus TaxID=182803 RepID=A0A4Y2GJZ6_ARAVE|nr:hypothetical protein AVEN_51517-1 [Araneus ventricosus]
MDCSISANRNFGEGNYFCFAISREHSHEDNSLTAEQNKMTSTSNDVTGEQASWTGKQRGEKDRFLQWEDVLWKSCPHTQLRKIWHFGNEAHMTMGKENNRARQGAKCLHSFLFEYFQSSFALLLLY